MISVVKQLLKRLIGVTIGARRVENVRSRIKKAISKSKASSNVIISTDYKFKSLSCNAKDTFVGYYDKTPFSSDNILLLGMSLVNKQTNIVDIGCFDLNEPNDFRVIGKSETWSWQLGTRLQWLPKRENEMICYNRIVDEKYGAVVQNVKTKKIEAVFGDPIYDISPEGNYAVTLNFSRLHRLRPGYGYGQLEDHTIDQLIPEDDGIFLIDLRNGAKKLIIGLHSISNLRPQSSMRNAEHYFNHLSFSPSGKRFMFLHLWTHDNRRHNRLITSDISGENLHVLEDIERVSHYAWKSDSELLAHTSMKPLGTRYYLYEDLSSEKKIVGAGSLNEPGHPSYSPDKKYILVDTYPDKYRRQKIRLHDEDGKLIKEIGSFFSPPNFRGANKCDLHPRWDRCGRKICFDSAYSGHRAICIIEVDGL